MNLQYTLDQSRDRVVAQIGVQGIPAPHWPRPDGNDCLGFLLVQLGVRKPTDFAPHFISIAAFRSWAGWDEIPTSDLEPGDLPCWNFSGGNLPEHIEFGYSFDHTTQPTATTVSANTGPRPGVPVPRGVWKKTRPITASLLFGIRPPYKPVEAVMTKKDLQRVQRIAAFLNNAPELNDLPNTAAEVDGRPGPIYRTLVQTWGRRHNIYGPTYKIDAVFGARSLYVEDVIDHKALDALKAAAARR